jgi:hypothetical protein
MSAITAVGFIPAAPLLVPDVAGGSAAIDAELRDACRVVARHLVEHTGDAIVVVAAGTAGGTWDESATWGFEGFGVERRPSDDRPRLPWQLGIGGWLLDDIGWTGSRRYVGATGAKLAVTAGTSVLVVGDGSACRSEKAPGHLDERAEAYDAAIAAAIAAGDVNALANLDAGLSAELMCSGAPTWRAVAEALREEAITHAELLIDAAPYGVGYFVGWWQRAAH